MMMGELVEAGHLGDPRLASSERGKALIDAKANALAQFIDLLKKDSVYWRGKK
jgi:creatinine amidohydrolase/Fe(II)-dependent formamide hydrolase-like protein